MCRRHRKREDKRMSAEASLAEAEAARRAQERKRRAEQAVEDQLAYLARDEQLAELFRIALTGQR